MASQPSCTHFLLDSGIENVFCKYGNGVFKNSPKSHQQHQQQQISDFVKLKLFKCDFIILIIENENDSERMMKRLVRY
jgi:hypothetical protein